MLLSPGMECLQRVHCSAPAQGTFTKNKNPMNKHDLPRLAVETRRFHFPGPVLCFPAITRGRKKFHISILSFPRTPAVPPPQISESCSLISACSLQPCRWVTPTLADPEQLELLCSLRNVTECFSWPLLPFSCSVLKSLDVGDNDIQLFLG